MATVSRTANTTKWRLEGNKRSIVFRIPAGQTTGEIDTGLTRVDFCKFTALTGSTDQALDIYRNSKTTTDNNGSPGWIHYTGGHASAVYQISVTGV